MFVQHWKNSSKYVDIKKIDFNRICTKLFESRIYLGYSILDFIFFISRSLMQKLRISFSNNAILIIHYDYSTI